MKIGFRTNVPNVAASIFYREALLRMDNDISVAGVGEYSNYDILLFMSYQDDLMELKALRNRGCRALVGVLDPRGKNLREFLPEIDFLVVDSLEMKDYWADSGKNIFTYLEYPNLPTVKRKRSSTDNIVLGYHGNLLHLNTMKGRVTPAIEKLAVTRKVELRVMYDVEGCGEWTIGRPNNVAVRHIQWSMDNYLKELADVDIGLVPGFIPITHSEKVKKKNLDREFREFRHPNHVTDDYLLRFKMPSNAGRIVVWGILGVSVIADFLPSSAQLILDGESGFLACSEGGWTASLKELADNPQLRGRMSSTLYKRIEKMYSFEKQNANFRNFLKDLHQGKTIL